MKEIYFNEEEKQILYLGDRRELGEITWVEASKLLEVSLGSTMTDDAFRLKYWRLVEKRNNRTEENTSEAPKQTIEKQWDQEGRGTITGIVDLPKSITNDPVLVQEYLGFPAHAWRLITVSIKEYEQHTKLQTTKVLCSVKLSVAPKKSDISLEAAKETAINIFKKSIKPYEFTHTTSWNKDIDGNRLGFIPGIELHLGKVAYDGPKEIYNVSIAKEVFKNIFKEFLVRQSTEKAGKLYIGIGNDLFNTDTTTYSTTRGTPQVTDIHWRYLFETALQLYLEVIPELEEQFNEIEFFLMPGNHDAMASFYLYQALAQHYSKHPKIKFNENYNEIQGKLFGDSLIVTAHGDKGTKRLVETLPVRFRKEWGQAKQVHLFTGHLHHKHVVLEKNGIVHHTLSAPTETDEWHDTNSFIGSIPAQEYFFFDKKKGLYNQGTIIPYIDKKKVLKLNNKKRD